MNVLRASLSLSLASLIMAGGAAAALATDDPAGDTAALIGTVPAVAAPQKVLFIGNSHTARHGGLDWLVANMVAAEDEPHPFEGRTRTASGVTLAYHYKNGAPNAIRHGGYDTVVLQGYLPGDPPHTTGPFLRSARLLDREVRGAGARSVFFMTWPQGRRDWTDLEDFIDVHRQLEAELGAPVAPVGVAFENARAERPDLVLIGDDEVHATWQGAYLAAATVYATLFDKSPEGLDYTFGVAPDDAAFLQRIAWQTVSDWNAGLPAGHLVAEPATRSAQLSAGD